MNDEFPRLLDTLIDRKHLDEAAAQQLMDQILTGELGPERLAALVTAMRAKGPTVNELVGFARSMRQHAHHIEAPSGVVLDNCGTGGAPCKTFNISTAAAFALATRVTVAKHGNRSVTRPSGSADVLERAGANLNLDPAAVEQVLASTGIAFLFAPTFHPAMRHAGPVRKALGIKTVFNLLGPLTNPAGATHQVLGVYDPILVPLMAQALARLGCQGGFVVHGLGPGGDAGFDEATPCNLVLYAEIRNGEAGPEQILDPANLGIPRCTLDAIAAVPAADAPTVLRAILSGTETGPRADAVALNVAFGLVATNECPNLQSGLETARAILTSGDGNTKLTAFLAATQP